LQIISCSADLILDSFLPQYLVVLRLPYEIFNGIDPLYALDTIDISRLISIHASDNFYNSFKDQHLPIGRGEIDWEKLFKRLSSYGFKGKLVVEVTDKGEDGKPLIESIEYLRNLGII
jgi:sugar phosphate isomerase/epimerase